jgi:VWFA-related protein
MTRQARWKIGFACYLTALAAQDRPIRTQTNVVLVPVSVFDRYGRSVDGLRVPDFSVLDNGIPQEITVDDFDTGLPPVSLVIAIQTSRISKLALAKINRIGGMIQPLLVGLRGEAAVVTFDGEINWLQDFTSEDDRIRQAVKSLKPGLTSRARMFDMIVQAADHFRSRAGRKILLLMGEGRDDGSITKFREALEIAERAGIEIFGAHYSSYAMSWISKSEDFPNKPELDQMFFTQLARLAATDHLRALTRITGGSDYMFLKERGIENSIESLGTELHSQYILSFARREDSTGRHHIEVTLPNRSDVKIRSRPSYWADPPN